MNRLANFLADDVDQLIASIALAAEVFGVRSNHLDELRDVSRDLEEEKKLF